MRENHFLSSLGSNLAQNTSWGLRPHCCRRAERTPFQHRASGTEDLLPQRKVEYEGGEVDSGPWGIVGRGIPLHHDLSWERGLLNQLREYQRFRICSSSHWWPSGGHLSRAPPTHRLPRKRRGQREGRDPEAQPCPRDVGCVASLPVPSSRKRWCGLRWCAAHSEPRWTKEGQGSKQRTDPNSYRLLQQTPQNM